MKLDLLVSLVAAGIIHLLQNQLCSQFAGAQAATSVHPAMLILPLVSLAVIYGTFRSGPEGGW